MGPIAVELLGKAALWLKNPVLLSPQGNDDFTLIHLATLPDLRQPRIRTIGLAAVLSRLGRLDDAFPLSESRCKRLSEVRNGAIHVGSDTEADNILTDCLTVVRVLLAGMGVTEESFLGPHLGLALALLDKARESLAGRVTLKLQRSRAYLADLETRLGGPAFDTACVELEAQRMALNSDVVLPGGTSVDTICPECGSKARLFGYVDADLDVEWDVEPLGGGKYETFHVASWEVSLAPAHMVCSVCKLQLIDRKELEFAGLPSSRMIVTEDDLDDPAFDFGGLIRWTESHDE